MSRTSVYSRCHLDSRSSRALLQDPTIPDALRASHVAEYWAKAVPRALSGPFADLRSVCFSALQTLCKCTINVIPASTVFVECIIAQGKSFVKRLFLNFFECVPTGIQRQNKRVLRKKFYFLVWIKITDSISQKALGQTWISPAQCFDCWKKSNKRIYQVNSTW